MLSHVNIYTSLSNNLGTSAVSSESGFSPRAIFSCCSFHASTFSAIATLIIQHNLYNLYFALKLSKKNLST